MAALAASAAAANGVAENEDGKGSKLGVINAGHIRVVSTSVLRSSRAVQGEDRLRKQILDSFCPPRRICLRVGGISPPECTQGSLG